MVFFVIVDDFAMTLSLARISFSRIGAFSLAPRANDVIAVPLAASTPELHYWASPDELALCETRNGRGLMKFSFPPFSFARTIDPSLLFLPLPLLSRSGRSLSRLFALPPRRFHVDVDPPYPSPTPL